MLRIGLAIFLFFSNQFLCKAQALSENEKFDFEINLYSPNELKGVLPQIANDKSISAKSFNYVYGWINVKEAYLNKMRGQNAATSCKIVMWNQFFKYTFSFYTLTKDKSYFLIPLGVLVADKKFEYKIIPIP